MNPGTQEYNPRFDNSKTEENMQSLGDIFKEDVTGSKIMTKVQKLQEQITVAKPLLKELNVEDSLALSIQKATPLLEIFYTGKALQDQLTTIPKYHQESSTLIARMFSMIAFKMDKVQELKDEYNTELGTFG